MAYVQSENRRFLAQAVVVNGVTIGGVSAVNISSGWESADVRPLDGLPGAAGIDRMGRYVRFSITSHNLADMYTAYKTAAATTGIIAFEKEVGLTTYTKHTIGSVTAKCLTVLLEFSISTRMGGFATATISGEVVAAPVTGVATTPAEAWIYLPTQTVPTRTEALRHRGPKQMLIGTASYFHHPTAFDVRIAPMVQRERADGFVLPSVIAIAGYGFSGSVASKSGLKGAGAEQIMEEAMGVAAGAALVGTLEKGDTSGTDAVLTVNNVKLTSLEGPLQADGGFTEYRANWAAHMVETTFNTLALMVTLA